MFRVILSTILMIFLIAVVGSVILEQFPGLNPLWEELKTTVAALYDQSIVKYGTITTIVLIVAIFIMVGSSKRM